MQDNTQTIIEMPRAQGNEGPGDRTETVHTFTAAELIKWAKRQSVCRFYVSAHARNFEYSMGVVEVTKPSLTAWLSGWACQKPIVTFEVHDTNRDPLEIACGLKLFGKKYRRTICIFPVRGES